VRRRPEPWLERLAPVAGPIELTTITSNAPP
jgi:hypothetical protein